MIINSKMDLSDISDIDDNLENVDRIDRYDRYDRDDRDGNIYESSDNIEAINDRIFKRVYSNFNRLEEYVEDNCLRFLNDSESFKILLELETKYWKY